jgi:DNA/RNA-binding domain of Phe-tRNA-synthetase-like protein
LTLTVKWHREVASKFPELAVCIGSIRNVKVEFTNEEIEKLRKQVFEEVRRQYVLENLKDDPIVRAYRDFFWSLDIDPTKTRPSGEALLRRVLQGKNIPKISNVVDAYNLASLKTIIPLSGFDGDKIFPPLTIRFSEENDVFRGIGMNSTSKLERKLLVLADQKRILCIYPHRDADATKITDKTENVLIVGYGAPKISGEKLKSAVETALAFIKAVAKGKIEEVKLYPCVKLG